jgi:hypothetical protein
MRSNLLAATMLAVAGFATPAHSALVNAYFESPGGDVRDRLDDQSIPGWTYAPGEGGSSYEIYESDNHDGLAAADGKHYVSFGHNGTYGGSISQTFSTTPGVTYRVSYYVAEQQDDDPKQDLRAILTYGSGMIIHDNTRPTARFRPGVPLVFTATGSEATLTFLDATRPGGGSIANLAVDRVGLTVVRLGGCRYLRHGRC